MRLRSILISLPLMLCVAQAIQPLKQVQAASIDASEATKLLAKSQAIDVKCGVLAKDQSQNLRNFVARAEISLAEKASVAQARKAITGGRAAGKTAICDEAAKKLVKDVLAAATAATAAPINDATTTVKTAPQPVKAVEPVTVEEKDPPAPVALVVDPPAPKKPALISKPQKPKARIAAVTAPKPVTPLKTVKPIKGLATYAVVAEKYYVALRCGSMSASRINGLYQTVLSNHRQALTSNRPRDVRNMLNAAEARAGRKSCI